MATRIETEREFHDAQARARAATFASQPHRLRFDDDEYLDHESWVRPAFAKLGDVAGLNVLDFGCGHGMASVVLARNGAYVSAFDLSPGYIAEARRRANVNHVDVNFVAADGERLPFADQSFDRIWGHAILHHLDVATAAREIRRVLKPRGIAVFCEPWGGNPLLSAARRWLPYAGKQRTPDETPLGFEQLAQVRQSFPRVKVEGRQLVGMMGRVLPGRKVLDRIDSGLLAAAPTMARWCRYAIVTLSD